MECFPFQRDIGLNSNSPPASKTSSRSRFCFGRSSFVGRCLPGDLMPILFCGVDMIASLLLQSDLWADLNQTRKSWLAVTVASIVQAIDLNPKYLARREPNC